MYFSYHNFHKINKKLKKKILREFQLIASAPDDNSLSSDQDTNQFLV